MDEADAPLGTYWPWGSACSCAATPSHVSPARSTTRASWLAAGARTLSVEGTPGSLVEPRIQLRMWRDESKPLCGGTAGAVSDPLG